MKDVGFFVGFFLVILFLALSSSGDNGQKGLFSSATSTRTSQNDTDDDTRDASENTSRNSPREEATYQSPPPPQPEPLRPEEVEARVAQIYRDLDELREDIRIATLWSPESPYKDLVNLRTGNVSQEDPDREYLILTVSSRATTSLNISHWYLRSYVTDELALIPNGDRLMDTWRNPKDEPIVLRPGERAYLITGESPIRGSFRENLCTGYLTNEENFFPSLSRACPSPKKELERFGGTISLDNDKCYAFIEKLNTCTEPQEETYTPSKVGGACRNFIENTFNYPDCVHLHQYDPYFSKNGYWYIYLDERNELWRPKREIIQLMDENDHVVDIIEY